MTDFSSDDLGGLRAAWQAASDHPPPVSAERLAAVRAEASAFDRAIRRRDRIELFAVGVVVCAFLVQIPLVPPLAAVGCVLAALGALYVGWRLVAAQRAVPPIAVGAPAAEALHQALRRIEVQIELLRRIAEWYLLPLLPGGLLFVYGAYAAAFEEFRAPVTAAEYAFVALVWVAPVLILGTVFGFIYWLNQRAVRRELIPLRDRTAALLQELE